MIAMCSRRMHRKGRKTAAMEREQQRGDRQGIGRNTKTGGTLSIISLKDLARRSVWKRVKAAPSLRSISILPRIQRV